MTEDNLNKENIKKLQKYDSYSINEKKELEEKTKKIVDNLNNTLKRINFTPNFNLNHITSYTSPEVVKEKNNWERHGEIVEIQNTIVKIQEEILKEQKSTSKISNWILGLTILSIIISILTLILTYYSIFYK